jgi:hypothetical protein
MTTTVEKARQEHALRAGRVQALSAQMAQKRGDLQRVRADEKAALVAGDDAAAERLAAEGAAIERRIAVLPAALEEAERAAAATDRVLADALLPSALEAAAAARGAFEDIAQATHERAKDFERAVKEIRWLLARSSYATGGERHGEPKPALPKLSPLAAGYRGCARELREADL